LSGWTTAIPNWVENYRDEILLSAQAAIDQYTGLLKWGQNQIRLAGVHLRTSTCRLALALLITTASAKANDTSAPNLAFLEFLGMSSELDQLGITLDETPPAANNSGTEPQDDRTGTPSEQD
jgi:hypothetical protein